MSDEQEVPASEVVEAPQEGAEAPAAGAVEEAAAEVAGEAEVV